MTDMADQYSRTRLLLGADGLDRLRNARVAIFGLGGVGGYAAEALARSGIGQMDLIDDARDEALASANKPYKSVLKPLISALIVKTGQLGGDSIWNTKINMFFDAIKRINKIQDCFIHKVRISHLYTDFA